MALDFLDCCARLSTRRCSRTRAARRSPESACGACPSAARAASGKLRTVVVEVPVD